MEELTDEIDADDDQIGLPVSQYRREWVNITPPPPPDLTRKNDIWAHELPHGMPKDSHLLPQHSQELLMAARSGRLWKRPAPAEEEETEADPTVTEKGDKKEEDPSTKGYRVKVWKRVPRNLEAPNVSYLGKRRKGTVTLSSSLPAGAAPGPTITKATVRRIDAAGNPYTQEVTLNEGQPVDGEIISTTVVAAPPPNVAVEASVTPVRRRPPPPKRKPKGPGRGRKKKLPLPATMHPNAVKPAPAGLVPGTTPVDGAQISKPDDEASKNNDIEMADDDEGDDGEDGEDEGEGEGDGDDDDEDVDGADGETPSVSRADSETKSDRMEATPSLGLAEGPASHLPPNQESTASANSHLPAPPPPSSHVEGSPLKQVVSAQSPGSLHPDPPSGGNTPKSAPTLGEVEQEVSNVKPESSLPLATNVSPVDEPAVTDITAPTDGDVKLDPDVEMEDAPPSTIDVPNEIKPQLTEDPIPIELPLKEDVQEETSSVVPPLDAESRDAGTAPSSDALISDSAQNESTAGVSMTQEATEPSVEPTVTDTRDTDAPSLDEQPIPPLEPVEFQDGAAAQEDNAPNSPDLFSGLEAALNQHGSSSSEPEPVPEKTEPADVPADVAPAAESPPQVSS
ncbi:hypothetical protein NPX13_g6563 [Xylaria arbuscula]|uniref:Uncharacterized protein n=1 Tax=Xylaria arbuscula TaxID=114810 RepID=A0A9W8NBZ2_9PEZI|nr:hypothetical protein NPX13_g6563 [Xylaria arbuscula]